jgi:signal transduction histidine kinase
MKPTYAKVSLIVQSLEPNACPEAWQRVDRLYDALVELGVSGATVVDAGAFLKAMRKRFHEHAAAKDVNVIVLATCAGVRVHARSFAEAMLNLVHNAIDAARPGSNVIVTVRPAGKSDVVWEIAGDGLDPTPGLADPTTPSLPALNVALAQLAVEAHGGLLNFESETGHGTSASVWIPDAREP